MPFVTALRARHPITCDTITLQWFTSQIKIRKLKIIFALHRDCDCDQSFTDSTELAKGAQSMTACVRG